MPVGNDVVDLRDPANQPSAIHARFDERVFPDAEILRLDALGAEARHHLRWTLWAARESAYKCLAQREPCTPFRPREMSVGLEGPLPGQPSGRVEWRGRELEIHVDCRAGRVHVVALEPGEAVPVAPVSALRRIALPSEPDPHTVSAAARVLAATTVARSLGVSASGVRITTLPPTASGRAGPGALLDGQPLPVDLSISHDGGWIACAVLNLRRGPAVAR